MGIIENDGSATGTKIIDDSGDYVVPQNTATQGINKTLAFHNGYMFKREITVECRSSASRDNLMLALLDPDGVIIGGSQYAVLNVTSVESFGVGDTNDIQVWTYRIELVMA